MPPVTNTFRPSLLDAMMALFTANRSESLFVVIQACSRLAGSEVSAQLRLSHLVWRVMAIWLAQGACQVEPQGAPSTLPAILPEILPPKILVGM